MTAAPPPMAVLDANVLYPPFLRDVLLRLAVADLFHPRWTERIHEEWTRNVIADRPDIPAERIHGVRRLMESSFPDARIECVPKRAENRLVGVHPGDRHVAAAAVAGDADMIVTRNLRHFPPEALDRFGIEPIDPDAFIVRIADGDWETIRLVLERHRAGLRKPALSPEQYRDALVASGLKRAAERLSG